MTEEIREMQILESIEDIQEVFDTGNKPVLVTCSDFNDWVCKYNRNHKYLVNEIIASEFLKIWEIPTPETTLIQIKRKHIPVSKFSQLNYGLFESPCFGSFYLASSKEVDNTQIKLFKNVRFAKKILNKEDFLRIALFDIWVGNDDRNHNNPNLLLNIEGKNQYRLYAIDHGAIFNEVFFEHPVALLTEDETLINTDLATALFPKPQLYQHVVDNIEEYFYLCTSACEKNLDEIIEKVPETWQSKNYNIKSLLAKYIFSENWKKECINIFKEYIVRFLQKSKK